MLYNFRDAQLPKMKQKMLYRSATLDDLDESEMVEILAKVNCILDLRGEGEGKRILNSIYEHYGNEEKRLRRINLAKSIRIAVWDSISFIYKIWYVIYTILQWKLAAKLLVFQNSFLKRDGLVGLYKAFLTNGQVYFKEIFTVLQDPTNYPVLVHCSAGKDRTGLTIALVQSLLGCERNAIVDSYSVSTRNLDMVRIRKEVLAFGLGIEFAETPKEVMIEVLAFVDKKYGSVSNYLLEIGIDLSAQAKVISILHQDGFDSKL